MPKSLAGFSGLAAALIFASCSSAPEVRAAVKPAKSRKAAPQFELKDSMGHPVKLSDYRGKVVLLNFWATWCGPCKIEIPWFIEFEKNLKDRGFAVVGMSMDEEGWDIVRPYIEKQKINYRMLIANDSVATLYGGVESLPTSFLIDREGKIAAIHVGLVSKKDYLDDIEQILGSEKAETKTGGLPVVLRSGAPAVLGAE